MSENIEIAETTYEGSILISTTNEVDWIRVSKADIPELQQKLSQYE